MGIVPDDEIIVYASNPTSALFKLRAIDHRVLGAVAIYGRLDSAATDLAIKGEYRAMFGIGRLLRRGDFLSAAFVDDIRAGFDVIRAPTLTNPNHVRIVSRCHDFDDVGREWPSGAFDVLRKVRK